MATLAQYNIDPKQVLHDATRLEPFNFSKSAKPTPLWIPGQDHTRVPNIILSQKLPHLDSTGYPITMRDETKAVKEGRTITKNSPPQTPTKSSDRKSV